MDFLHVENLAGSLNRLYHIRKIKDKWNFTFKYIEGGAKLMQCMCKALQSIIQVKMFTEHYTLHKDCVHFAPPFVICIHQIIKPYEY